MISNFTRLLSATLVGLFLAAGQALAVEVSDRELRVTAPQVQEYLSAAFPQSYDALGLFTLTARDPQLSIPPTGQRLQMKFSADASAPGRGSAPVANITMSSGLRYDPAAYAVFLDQPTLDGVEPVATGQRLDQQTRMLLNLWLADYARAEPVYRLEPSMVAMLGSMNVESTRIEDQHIVIRFNKSLGWVPDPLD